MTTQAKKILYRLGGVCWILIGLIKFLNRPNAEAPWFSYTIALLFIICGIFTILIPYKKVQ